MAGTGAGAGAEGGAGRPRRPARRAGEGLRPRGDRRSLTSQPVRTQSDWFADLAREALRRGREALDHNDLAQAERWLARAASFAPEDATIRLAQAEHLLRSAQPAAAAEAFAALVARHPSREGWLGLAAAHMLAGDVPRARTAAAHLFARYVVPDTASVQRLGEVCGAASGGWCAVAADGLVLAGGQAVRVLVDGRPGTSGALPRRARELVAVTASDRHVLGSPIRLDRLYRTEGFVAAERGGLRGWAWCPSDPDHAPRLTVHGPGLAAPIELAATDTSVPSLQPLSQPRGFHVPAQALAGASGPLQVAGEDGSVLLGSPLDPAAEARSAAAVAAIAAGMAPASLPRMAAVPADVVGPPAQARGDPGRPAAVVVPAYRGLAETLACLRAVAANVPAGTRVIVVDDACPDPELRAALAALGRAGAIELVRNPVNLGFPGSANVGLRAVLRGRRPTDAVLLNSDTLVSPGWLAALHAAVHAAPDVGTATPLSNDATILSYPDATRPNPAPPARDLRRLAALAARANAGAAVDIPTAVGFCVYIRAECLRETGLFREDLFAQGYGEENDFCLRARHLGWRHVAVPGAYVAHLGGTSFGTARQHLLARNLAVLERLHPGYRDLVAAFVAADPLHPHRRRLDALRWRQGRSRAGAVVLVTHDAGGGVERVVQRRRAEIEAAGQRAILLRPVRSRDDPGRTTLPGRCAVGDGRAELPNLTFALPGEWAGLVRLLRADRPVGVELHHLLGHDPRVLGLAEALGVPQDVHVHDYAWFCPRVTLVNAERRYCGEPAEVAVCEACVADGGSRLEETIGVAALRARSAGVLAGARRVVAPSRDAAARLRRWFPAVAAQVRPHEDDPGNGSAPVANAASAHVLVIGGIGVEKGYDVILACARDAAARALPLRFTLLGHTPDDERLMATGRVFVTGPYQEKDAVSRAAATRAHLSFLPSIWPETWCFTLGIAWQAGLRVAAFDLGAPAERIRATGRGLLLPLGLPPASVNAALLAAARAPI